MKRANAFKAILLSSINEISANHIKYAVNSGRDFIRNRKIGFNNLILMLLIMEADTFVLLVDENVNFMMIMKHINSRG